MATHLHILNGDGTAGGFQQSGLMGDIAIWREILCEGPVGDLNAASFFENRATFLDNPQFEYSYEELMLPEFAKIKNYQQYDEVTLWFEHDLFCQINLIGLLSWFAAQDMSTTTLSLVCIHQHENHTPFYGLGQLYPNEFPPLFEKRSLVSADILQLAKRVWEAYCDESPLQLQQFIKEEGFEGLPYLKQALEHHLSRFPHAETGINTLEKRVLDLLHEQQELSYKQLMRQLLSEQNQYWGFGDLQYKDVLHHLSPLLESDDHYRLSAIGKAVRVGEEQFSDYRMSNPQLGGSFLKDWMWKKEDLVKAVD